MYEAKTKPTKVSVASYLAAIEDPARRADCTVLSTMMTEVTGCPAVMWGTGIVGFDAYHYRYDSGHEGDSCVVGFASRKGDISVYLLAGYDRPEVKAMLAQLGKHKTGKACLYIKRLADVNLPVLQQLIAYSVADTRKRYPSTKSS
ncbi:MAG: DUF1801 domain-containing protein [Gemmatimonadaceae bacterium]|nr:DUF1801 domain-containing protein [Gemmatimonadaceae bacterium]